MSEGQAENPRSRRAAGVLTVTVAAALVLVAIGLRRTAPPPSGLEGQRVEPIALPRLPLRPQPEVERITLGAANGRATLVHFWGPSCAPCVEEAPQIAAVSTAAGGFGAEVWTVSAEDVVEIRAFLLGAGLQLPVLHDATGQAHERFRVAAIPHTFVLGKDGAVRHEWLGPQDKATLLAALRQAQNE